MAISGAMWGIGIVVSAFGAIYLDKERSMDVWMLYTIIGSVLSVAILVAVGIVRYQNRKR